MAKVKVVYAHTIAARDRANAALLAGQSPDDVAAMLGADGSVSEAEAGPDDNWPTLVYTRRDAIAERDRKVAEDAKAAKSTARGAKSGGE